VEPAQALDGLPRALGVPDENIPPGVEERAGLYWSVLAQVHEPVLVIADNASSEAQVRPLLPGTGPHKVLVTSRHTLAGLGARLVDVTVLDDDAAVALLDAALRAAHPDDNRITGDQKAARQLAMVCGGLPLALQITAALLSADPALSAAELARELCCQSARLERLRYDDGGGPGAPSVLRRSSCPTAGWRRPRRESSGCCRSIPARISPPLGPRSWRTCRSARLAGCWRSWPKRTWPKRLLAQAAVADA
jgi:hypothetical protein